MFNMVTVGGGKHQTCQQLVYLFKSTYYYFCQQAIIYDPDTVQGVTSHSS